MCVLAKCLHARLDKRVIDDASFRRLPVLAQRARCVYACLNACERPQTCVSVHAFLHRRMPSVQVCADVCVCSHNAHTMHAVCVCAPESSRTRADMPVCALTCVCLRAKMLARGDRCTCFCAQVCATAGGVCVSRELCQLCHGRKNASFCVHL